MLSAELIRWTYSLCFKRSNLQGASKPPNLELDIRYESDPDLTEVQELTEKKDTTLEEGDYAEVQTHFAYRLRQTDGTAKTSER